MSYTINAIDPEDAAVLDKAFNVKGGLIEYNPGKCMLPPYHEKICKQLLDAPIKEDDVWLLSYPRTGSTWCQEIVWLLGNNLDYKTAQNTIQQLRAPLIEMSTALIEYRNSLGTAVDNSVDYVNNLSSPRFIKSHLPHSFLPTQLDIVKPKIVYICRNPKDMCVSYYNHLKMVHNYDVPFEVHCDLLIRGLLPIGPVFPHYLAFWNKRNDPNVLFLKYEDLKCNLKHNVKKIANFLNKNYTENQYDELCDFVSFDKMRYNRGCNLEILLEEKRGKGFLKEFGNQFIRKGIIGDWKNYMTPDLSRKFDNWIEDNLKGTGLTFD